MEMIADILLIAAALAATIYCVVLSYRLRRFTDLEKGVGGAIAILSVQVDDMTKTLESARIAAAESVESLGTLTGRAETAAKKLELLVAAMHDLPEPVKPAPTEYQNNAEKKDEEPLFLSARVGTNEAAE